MVDPDLITMGPYDQPRVKLASWDDGATMWRLESDRGHGNHRLLYIPNKPFNWESVDLMVMNMNSSMTLDPRHWEISRRTDHNGILDKDLVHRLRWLLLELGFRREGELDDVRFPLFWTGGNEHDEVPLLLQKPLPRLQPPGQAQTQEEEDLQTTLQEADQLLLKHDQLAKQHGYEVITDGDYIDDWSRLRTAVLKLGGLIKPVQIREEWGTPIEEEMNRSEIRVGHFHYRRNSVTEIAPNIYIGLTLSITHGPPKRVSQHIIYPTATALWERLTSGESFPLRDMGSSHLDYYRSSASITTPEELPSWTRDRTQPGRLSISEDELEVYKLLDALPFTQPWEQLLEWARAAMANQS